jgi:hypothetical protein
MSTDEDRDDVSRGRANDDGDKPGRAPLDPRIRNIARAIGRHIADELARSSKAIDDEESEPSD